MAIRWAVLAVLAGLIPRWKLSLSTTMLQIWDVNFLQFLLVLFLAVLLYFYLSDNTSDYGYPPGPWRLPLIDNLHQVLLAGSVVQFCEKYRRLYGNVRILCVALIYKELY